MDYPARTENALSISVAASFGPTLTVSITRLALRRGTTISWNACHVARLRSVSSERWWPRARAHPAERLLQRDIKPDHKERGVCTQCVQEPGVGDASGLQHRRVSHLSNEGREFCPVLRERLLLVRDERLATAPASKQDGLPLPPPVPERSQHRPNGGLAAPGWAQQHNACRHRREYAPSATPPRLPNRQSAIGNRQSSGA